MVSSGLQDPFPTLLGQEILLAASAKDQSPVLWDISKDTGGMGCLGPPPSLSNHLLPRSSDPGSALQSLEEQETKGLGA